MELETINKLYLELSQVATATTGREYALHRGIGEGRQTAMDIAYALRIGDTKKAYSPAEKLEAQLNDLLP